MSRVIGLGAALTLVALLVAALGAAPLEVGRLLLGGSLGTPAQAAYVAAAFLILLLCCAGLLLTFAAGLWNIGFEGQIVMGAVFATGALRYWGGALPPWGALLLAAAAAAAGGALWALLAGALRSLGNVNEIFGGLGLYFIANSLTVWLVLGPWRRVGVASTSGTEPFPPELWLTGPAAFPVSPIEVILGLGALLGIGWLLRGTYFGLRLKSVGLNPRAAFRLGVPTGRTLAAAFCLSGGLAGLAGWLLVIGTSSRHQLYPLISSSYGFIAILIVLLAGQRPLWCLPIAFLFAAIIRGSTQLSVAGLDSALAGVVQGLLVLGLLMARGWETRRRTTGRLSVSPARGN